MHHILKSTAIGAAGLAIGFALPNFNQSPTTATPSPQHSTSNRIHRVVIQVTQNDPAVMNMALNNAENLVKFYQDKGEKIQIEFVAYGAGLNIFRSDTSPVKDRLATISANKNISFSGCGNTLAN